MATRFNFNGRLVKLPGVYTEIKSGVNNPPLDFSYGNVVIIDTDATNAYGGGSGINGEIEGGEGAIYSFDNLRDLRDFVGGGPLWDLALPLFKPFGSGSQGASEVHIVRALSTVAAASTFTLDAGGSIEVETKYEGLVGNGVEGVVGQLTQGFALTMEAGVIDPTKFRFVFSRGTYKGVDSEGLVLDGLSPANSIPEILATSDEVSTLTELKAWADNDFEFNNYFQVGTFTVGTDTITATDLTATSGNQLFSGGSQTGIASDFSDMLEAIKKLDYTFILSLDGGANATSANNYALQFHIQNEAKYQKYMVVAGGDDKNTFTTQSIAAANGFDSNRVIVVHGGCKIQDKLGGSGLRTKSALYKAAAVLGRTCGLEPQIPITFKGIDIAGEIHRLTDRERERALDEGVLTTYWESEVNGGIFAITQGINTLQNNRFVVNDNGTSHQISLERIAAQLNKEIEINAKDTLLGNQNAGPNRSTLSPEIVQEWTENYLRTKEATATQDNLILSFQDITVSIVQDAYKIGYSFVPNFEVNKLFFTGLIIDPNLS